MDIGERKRELRSRMKARREAIDCKEYRSWCTAIMERAFRLPEFQQASTIHTYVSAVNNEVDTLGILFRLLDLGKIVAVPRCIHGTRRLVAVRIHSLEELLPSRFGLMEPAYEPGREVDPRSFDLVLVPLLAFDRSGGRLGFGRGYYDSLLAECACPKLGLAYSFQESPSVPAEPHDEKLDIVITERETIRIGHE